MSHPIHSALVHFPVACWSLATFFDCGVAFLGFDILYFATILLLIGLLSGFMAMLAGLIEIVKIENSEVEALHAANLHMGAAITTWCLYGASAFIQLNGIQPTSLSMMSFSLSIIGFFWLMITGWLGGNLVYKHHVGLQAKK